MLLFNKLDMKKVNFMLEAYRVSENSVYLAFRRV